MKKLLFALSLLATASFAGAAPATSSAPPSSTLELDVVGLNCSLCSEEMKAKLMTLSGARDIEPRLECGKIYLDMPAGARLNDRGLAATLLQKGFTYEGSRPVKKTMAEVRKTAPEKCG